MPRLPLPEATSDEITTLEPGTRIWRVYRAASLHRASWSTFRHYGPVAIGRFDHQEPPPHEDEDRAILYGSLDGPAAVVEAFQDARAHRPNAHGAVARVLRD